MCKFDFFFFVFSIARQLSVDAEQLRQQPLFAFRQWAPAVMENQEIGLFGTVVLQLLLLQSSGYGFIVPTVALPHPFHDNFCRTLDVDDRVKQALQMLFIEYGRFKKRVRRLLPRFPNLIVCHDTGMDDCVELF